MGAEPRAGVGRGHLPLGVQGLLCAQQHLGQHGEEPEAHLRVPGRLQAAAEDGHQVGQRCSEGGACNTEAPRWLLPGSCSGGASTPVSLQITAAQHTRRPRSR